MRLKTFLLIIIVCYFAFDVIFDIFTEEIQLELLFEAIMFFIASTLLVQEIRKNQHLSEALIKVKQQHKLLSTQLNELIESKFVEWKLTKAETETAFLLIKGFSISEIAILRDVKEKTVHHQLTSIYSKSSTRNRSEFSSEFFQMLFEAGQQSELI